MSGNERGFLIASLILNAILIAAVIFLFVGRGDNASEEVAQAVTSVPTVEPEPTAVMPTQTPVIETVVVTVVSTPTTMPVEATPTATAVTEEEPTPTVEPSPTVAPSPTPQPTPTEAVFTGPDWLKYTNLFRVQANLPLLVEESSFSEGAAAHSMYMVQNSSSSHSENPGTPGYSDAGNLAGKNGNIAISGQAGTTYYWPIEYWISASFHAIPMLDPDLERVGYGEYQDVNSSFGMAATMDVKRGLRAEDSDNTYPIMFPKDGGETWVRKYSMPEFPNTASGCSGYQKPTGAPIILMLGNGDSPPNIYETRLLADGNPVPHCAFDETNYYNPDAYWQDTGRTILSHNNCVVILPRSPFEVGQEVTVFVNNGGEEIEWTFTIVDHPATASE